MSLYDEIINGTYKKGVTKINYKKKEDEDDYNSYNNLYDSIKSGTDYSVNNINTNVSSGIPDMSNNKLYKSIIDGTFGEQYAKSKNANKNVETKIEEKEPASFGQKAGWVAKKTLAGAAGGVTGIGQAAITDVANNIQQGKEKGLEGIKEDLKGTDKIQKERNELVKDSLDTTVKVSQIMNDKNTSKVEKVFNLFMYGIGQVMNKIGKAREDSAGGKLINAPVQALGTVLPESTTEDLMNINQNISKPIEEMNQRLAEEGQNYGIKTQWIGNAMQSVGNMTPSIAATLITKNPSVGLGIMGISAKGQSTEEALKKGARLNEAVKIGDEKAMVEIGTELLTGGVNIFGKGALDDILKKGIVDKVKNNVAKFFVQQGVNVLGETLEETIADIVDTAIDKGTIDPNATYSLKDWSDTAIETALSTFVLNLITGGMVNDVRNIKNNGTELKTVIDAEETKPLFVTKTTPDGNISFVESTQGIPIENSNNDLNINPAIVYNNKTDTYNVIDSNTGLLLDNSPYLSILSAKIGFNEKTTNISEAQVKKINDSVVKTELALIQKTNEIITELEENEKTNRYNNINIENNINNQQNTPTQINQDNAETNLNNETNNLISENKNNLKTENNVQGLENYTRNEIKTIVNDDIQSKLEENMLDNIRIKDSEIIGSRNRGNAKNNSDLDVVVEYEGDINEDDLFNILNEEPLEIDGIKVDINPITANKTGTLQEYLERSNQYDKEIIEKDNNSLYNNENEKGVDLDGKRKRQIRNGNNEKGLDRSEKKKNTRGNEEDGRTNGVVQREQSKGLSNYEKQKQEKLGKDFKAEIIDTSKVSKNEQIVAKGFNEATGLTDTFYRTNKSTTESAFYNANGVFQKDKPLSKKKALNHAPYHEFGHWLKDNMPEQWNKLYDIMDKTITDKQITDYIGVLNNKEDYAKMTKEQKRESVINEVISDSFGNWANDVLNWSDFIQEGLINEEYQNFLTEITDENESVVYPVFGTIEQEQQMNEAITEIMKEVINNKGQESGQVDDDVPLFSNRKDIEAQQEIDIILDMKAEKYYNKNTDIYLSKEQYRDFSNDIWIALTDNGIKLSKKEFGRISHEIETNHALQPNTLYGKAIRNHFYGYEKIDEGQFKFYARIRIDDNNTPFIESIERRYLDEQRTRFTNRIIQELEDRFGNNNNDNVISERTSKDTSINTISNKEEKTGQKPKSNNDNERSNENSSKLKNSKQGSFIIPKKVKDIKNLNQFINKAAEQETDKYWKGQLEEAKAANYIDWTRKESRLHWKRGIVQQYLDYKNGVEYSDRTDITEDSEGNKLTKAQQDFFKDSKARDDNGKLSMVYHTTTDRVAQFNEFNPTTTKYYRFGDQVVNYFTDSQDMSGSYANSNYKVADTTKIENINQAKKWIDKYNNLKDRSIYNYTYDVEKADNGMLRLIQYERRANGENQRIGTYADLKYKDLIQYVQMLDHNFKNLQYQGYLNITNPYIVNAEGKNWNKVQSNIDKEILSELNEIKKDKDKVFKLKNLQKESLDKYLDYISGYKTFYEENIKDTIKDIGRGQSNDLKEALEYCMMFGFNFDKYVESLNENYNINGNTKIKDIYDNYLKNHDVNDIKNYKTKMIHFADKTINNFLKKAHEYYTKDMIYGREYSYFKENYAKIIGKSFYDYSKENNITPENLYKIAKDFFSKDVILEVLGENETTNDIVKKVIEMNKNGSNYDGIIMKNVIDYGGIPSEIGRKPANLYVTFNSNQFKAKDNLNPTNDPDIRYSDRYDVDKDSNYGFYSQLEKVIEEKMPNTTNAQQLKGILDKAGIKQDEMKWIGLDDYLKAHSLEKLSKEKVMEYIKANQIYIETVQKGKNKLDEYTEPVKQDIASKNIDIQYLLDKYGFDYEENDLTPYKRNGLRAGTIGDFMADSLQSYIDLNDFEKYEKQEDGSYIHNYRDSDGISWTTQFTEKDLKEDMQKLEDLYDQRAEAEMQLSMLEDEYGDYSTELGVPKYEQYSIKGGTNYQEKLYTLSDESNIQLSGVDNYRSPHWDEKNVLAHVRTQDFEDINGNKVLFIDEIQSDLHQEGRKKGYLSEEESIRKQNISNKINDIKDTRLNLREKRQNLDIKIKENVLKDIAEKQNEILNKRKNNNLESELTTDEKYELLEFQDKMNQIYSTVIEKHNIFNINSKQNMVDLLKSYEINHLPESIKNKFKNKMDMFEDYIIDSYKLNYLYDRQTDIEHGWTTLRDDEIQNAITKKEYKDREQMMKEDLKLYAEIVKLEEELSKIKEGILDIFPFKKNWHEFALRRIINDAVSQGYDEVAWTTGRQQRERYNLSQAIDYIEYQKLYDHPKDVDSGKVGTVEITAYKDGSNVFERQIPANELADYIGKDLSMKIFNAKEGKGTITNLDEDINKNGNSGMYLFYDQEIPSYLNKYLKKWNSKVEPITIKNIDGKDESVQPGFKITKEMRESIKQNGQPLFSDRADIDDESKTPKREYTKEEKEYIENQRRERLEVAKMIKERSFLNNILQSNVDKDFKKILRNNKDKFNYEPISNETTMKEASERVDKYKDLEMAKNEFLQNELQTATDTAVGELLIRKALANGNYQEANQITAALAEKLTTAGQTVQAAAMFKRMTPEGMLMFAQRKINQINKELSKEYGIDKLLKKKEIKQLELTEEKVNFINEMMKQMQDWENKKKDVTDGKTMEIIEREQDIILAKVMAKIGEGIPVSKMDKIAAWRNISLLLNTKTINRNLVSNALFSSLENIVDMLGVPIDKAISLMTGERSLLMPNLKTQFKGLKKGLDYAIFDTKEGISTSLGGNKYEIKPSKTFENKLLNKLETLTYFGVEGLDRPFMQSKYDSALEMLMKLDGLEYGKDIPTEEMKQEALDMAKYTTFKDKNVISDFLSKTKNTLNMGKSVGLADVIGLTYTNIPGNLTKKAIDYSPAGLYNIIKSYKNLKAKQISGESLRQAQREFVQSTARVLIGTGIMTASIRAVLAGILTASGDDEDDKVKSLTDQENYAINVSAFLRWLTGRDTAKQNGDLYVTYSNYEPLSSIIAAAAEMVGSAKKGDNLGTIAYKGLTTWINTIAELSTLSNFSSLFEYGDLGGTLTRSIAQFPASFIPTTSKQIAQLFEQNSKSSYSDNYFTKNFINPILQRIPGLSSTLQSNYDTMGNEEENYNGSEGLSRLFNVFLNTSFTSTVNMDNVEQELYDLYLSTGNTDHLPLQVKNNFIYKGQKITLTAEEKAKYQETLGKRTAEEFKKVMATDEYKNMTDEDKVKKLKNIISDINTDVKGEVVLEPRGIAYDTTFTPSGSSLSKGGYSLNLTEDMQKEYEQIAADYYNKYAKQGLYSEDKLKELKSKAKEYAKNEMFKTYKDKIHKTK